uniref:NADH-ubiquinone oxidoreductase chain 3 n=1 Tax=Paduniella communis TaxID=2904892 RepID=A0A9E8RUW4_9NEOP|nr:NADH dehydrogenase subunit 3 [Paduniella communis]UZZ44253.1 NADH dehydrogenase subunit 3 [Paduniella communis]
MKLLMINFTIISLISIILIMLNIIISKKIKKNQEKNSTFECGFNPNSKSRLPFSIHFFIITMLFLIFDIEITILLPFLLTMNNCNMFNYMLMFYFFLIILIASIIHEWNQNILNWKI